MAKWMCVREGLEIGTGGIQVDCEQKTYLVISEFDPWNHDNSTISLFPIIIYLSAQCQGER
jgi:hypothetical protein